MRTKVRAKRPYGRCGAGCPREYHRLLRRVADALQEVLDAGALLGRTPAPEPDDDDDFIRWQLRGAVWACEVAAGALDSGTLSCCHSAHAVAEFRAYMAELKRPKQAA